MAASFFSLAAKFSNVGVRAMDFELATGGCVVGDGV